MTIRGWNMAQWMMLVVAAPAAIVFIRLVRQGKAQNAFSLVFIFGYIWALGEHLLTTIELFFPNERAYWFALCLCYLGMCALGPSSVQLSWCYSGKYWHYRDKRKLFALYGVGALFWLVIVTNDWHHLYYQWFSLAGRAYSIMFYPFTILSHVYLIYALLVLLRARLADGERSRRLFLICFGAPLAANTWGMFASPGMDFTPLAYCLMLAGSYVIALQYRPVSLLPLATHHVLDSMDHPAWVQASDGTMIYENGVEARAGRVYRTVETQLEDGNCMVMHIDITQTQALLDARERQHAALMAANERLRIQGALLDEQSKTAAVLAAEQERMEIMSLLDSEVRGTLDALWDNTQQALTVPEEATIREGQRLSMEALEQVRRIVRETKRRPWQGV